MGLFDSILGAASGEGGASGQANPLIGIVGGLLAQSGGLQGLANKFGRVARKRIPIVGWHGRKPADLQQSSSKRARLRAGQRDCTRMGVDPAIVSTFLAEYLPKIVDKLTPAGKIDPAADHQQGLAALLPSLLQSLGGQSSTTAQRRA
jgi:Uncharacterized protein conserved in bacteria